MNIMIAADYAAPKSGNFIASIIALGRRLRNNGAHVLFVFPEEKEWIQWFNEEQFDVEILNKTNVRVGMVDSRFDILKKIVINYDIELIHSHFGLFHHELVYRRSEFKRLKVIIHDHMDFGITSNIIIQRVKTALYSCLYQYYHINLITVMEQKRNAYIFLKNKWFVPNGLSLERHIKNSMSREDCRREIGLKQNEKCVFLLGWDLKRKGLDIALKAVQKCREMDDTICFGMIGVGCAPSVDAKEFIVQETGIDPSESWIHFFDSYEDMFAVHRAVDVYLSASRKEAFSYGLLESISQNTPVVVSDIPGTKWAEIYDNSYFYPVEDVEACAKAIMAALNTGRKVTNSIDIVDKYGIERWCDRIIQIYRSL